MSSRRTRAASVLVAAVVLLGAVVVVGARRAPVAAATRRACNGRPEYCTRRLDQIALPTSHNSNAARDSGVLFPNQQRTMAAQLDDGIRGFQIDAFLGTVRKRAGVNVVFTDLTPRAQAKLAQAAGQGMAARAARIRTRVGPPPRQARYDVYLCHNFCELGAVPMLDEARTLARFLDAHPDEVVVWIVQDELPAARLRPVLRAAGLERHLATLDPTVPLPTLGAMIDSGHRLVVGLENGDLGPQIPNVFERGLVQEVPYRYVRVADLAAADSCRPLRGYADAPLFQFNHWVTPASRRASREVNAYDFLYRRARRCERERHHLPNLVAVDFTDVGNLFRVTDALNARR
jgi:hypothetical protein